MFIVVLSNYNYLKYNLIIIHNSNFNLSIPTFKLKYYTNYKKINCYT